MTSLSQHPSNNNADYAHQFDQDVQRWSASVLEWVSNYFAEALSILSFIVNPLVSIERPCCGKAVNTLIW